MGLWTILEAGLLFVNALAIIDEERCLKPRTCTNSNNVAPC